MDEKVGRQLHGPDETAAAISTSRSGLDALVRAGLPHYDVTLPGRKRRRLRFDLDEVRAWLRARAKAA